MVGVPHLKAGVPDCCGDARPTVIKVPIAEAVRRTRAELETKGFIMTLGL